MAARDVPEPAVTTHPGIAIWGTLEARVQSAELVILGGLNEGAWPRLPAADPWLGRGLRRAIGLPSPDRRIGLSAHDFQQAMGAPRVILTRATRDAEAPTVASRWLLRLENLLLGLGPEGQDALAAAKARGQPPRRRRRPPRPPRRPRAAGPPPRAAPAGGGAPRRALRHPGRAAGPRPLRASTPARSSASAASTRPAASPTRSPAAPPSTPRSTTSSPPPRPACPPTPPRSSSPPSPRALADGRALARGQRHLDRAPRPRRAAGSSPARPSAAPAARPPPARSRAAARSTASRTPFAITARADRIDRAARRRSPSTTTSPAPAPPPAEARAFHLQLPLEAAIAEAGGFEGLPPAPRSTSSS